MLGSWQVTAAFEPSLACAGGSTGCESTSSASAAESSSATRGVDGW